MLNKDKNVKIRSISIYGIIVGLFNIFIGISGAMKNEIFFILGIICIFLSFGLLKGWRWIRILILLFCFIIILLYLLFIILTVIAVKYPHKIDPLIGVSLFFYFPILLLSLFFTTSITKKNNDRGTIEGRPK